MAQLALPDRRKTVGSSAAEPSESGHVGLQLAQKQMEVGQVENADQTLVKVLSEFQSLDEDLGRRESPGTAAGGCAACVAGRGRCQRKRVAGRVLAAERFRGRHGRGWLRCAGLSVRARSAGRGAAGHADAALRRTVDDFGHPSRTLSTVV